MRNAKWLRLFVWVLLMFFTLGAYAQPSNSLHPVRKFVGQIQPKTGDVIENVSVSNPNGTCIVVHNDVSNVVIRNSRIGPCGNSKVNDYGVLILERAKNITVTGNVIFNVASGVKAHGSLHPIIVERNFFYGIRGPMWSGQAVQFNSVFGDGASSRINCNVSDAFFGNSNKSYEDHISMYKVRGTKAYPVEIAGNRIRGGTSKSGGGITVGDKGGEWFVVRDNVLVTVANSGIGVAGGSNVLVLNNIVDNRGKTAESLTHVAYYVRALTQCSDITLKGNRGIARLWIWGETDGRTIPGYRHGPEKCLNVVDGNNLFGDKTIPDNIFDVVPETCNE